MTQVDLFDYELPEDLIAATPAGKRDESRLLCLDRAGGAVAHRAFADVRSLLRPGDVLVVNDARVIPARLGARRDTGGKVEVLLLRQDEGADQTWLAMLGAGGALREGETLELDNLDASLHLVQERGGGHWLVRLSGESAADVLGAGEMPLPPYIRKARRRRGMPDAIPELDRDRYQTIYARHDGAVAAPTAGLHFTKDLMDELKGAGVLVRPLTLLVGPGTFRPVRTPTVEEHVLDAEFYHLPGATAEAVLRAKEEGRRVVATGTTCCRVLERAARQGEWHEHSGWTDLYIYPPFEFRAVDALITNFHLPRSTLLMLVCAFAGRESVLRAYAEAVREEYRFYSYGDAMFIA